MACKHRWILGTSVNDFETNLVITPGRCKQCGEARDFQAPALDGIGALYKPTPTVAELPDGFHLEELGDDDDESSD